MSDGVDDGSEAGDGADEVVDDGADDRETGEDSALVDSGPSTGGRDAPTDDRGRDASRDDRGRDGGDATEGPDPFANIDAVAGAGDPFESMDVEPVDDEAVWADLAGGDLDGTAGGGATGERADAGDVDGESADGTGPAVEVEGDEAVVPKRSYCERCEHFSDPPETACTNPGTEIRELVDVEHFRVANCPVVERRRHIGGSTED